MSNNSDELSTNGTDFDNIPIIDLNFWWSSNADDHQQIIDQVYKACTQIGFFYIKNHGIPQQKIDRVHDAAQRFFSLPEEAKMEGYLGKSKKFHGFSPLFAELSTGADLDDPKERAKQVCFSEAFDIGYEIEGDSTKTADNSLPVDQFNLYGGNQWLDERVCPGFRSDLLSYYATALQLCRELMKIFARALGLQQEYFDDKMRYPGAMARVIHYPPQLPTGETRAGLSAHTDYECVTVLSQGNVPALDVLNRSGHWVPAYPIPGTLVVNIGDCLSMWTNHKFKSTIHRVSNRTGQERYTVPFFFGVDYDTTMSVLESCITTESPACTTPMKVGQWVREKLSKGYVGYGAPPPDPDLVRNLVAAAKE